MDYKYLLRLIIPILIISTLFMFALWERQLARSLCLKAILEETPSGTPIRLEREFKLGLESNDKSKFSQPHEIMEGLYDALNQALINKKEWKIEPLLENFYYTTYKPVDYLFRDIYLDTKDNLNRKYAVSYRLRHRWKTYKAYKDHEQEQFDERFFPIRCEIQVKTDRQEIGNGYSTVYETRFEFRDQSQPFSDINPAPRPPWDFESYLHYGITGRFMDYIISPACEYAKFIIGKEPTLNRLWLKPKLITLTRRFRVHLNVNTPWGSGPNPDDVFIISLDLTEVFGPEYLDYLIKAKYGNRKSVPPPKGYLREMEIEFERNVSTVLDKRIKELERQDNQEDIKGLIKIREAFLSDQMHLKKIIEDYFKGIGIELIPSKNSKYSSAFDVVYKENAR